MILDLVEDESASSFNPSQPEIVSLVLHQWVCPIDITTQDILYWVRDPVCISRIVGLVTEVICQHQRWQQRFNWGHPGLRILVLKRAEIP